MYAIRSYYVSGIVNGTKANVRDYLYTENLWSTHFGNPRCEAVQNKEWKYIRYYKNNNVSANNEVAVAKMMGIPVGSMLYSVHDPDIAVYRSYIEDPIKGEKPVYEELYHLTTDPAELHNLIADTKYADQLNDLKAQWAVLIKEARGTENPKVMRYTADSYNFV